MRYAWQGSFDAIECAFYVELLSHIKYKLFQEGEYLYLTYAPKVRVPIPYRLPRSA